MTTVSIPSSPEEVITELGAVSELLTATEWKRAALLAAVVRLPGSGSHNKQNRGTAVLTPEQFARKGIKGLRSPNTVRAYVQNWLDASDGTYPTPGQKVTLPDLDWPPTSLEDDRYQGVSDRDAIAAQAELDGTGVSKAIDIAKNKRAMMAAIKASPEVAAAALSALTPEVLAEAVRRPEVAQAVHDDYEAATQLIRLTGRAGGASGRGGGGRGHESDAINALTQSILEIVAEKYAGDAHQLFTEANNLNEDYIWRPKQREALIRNIQRGVDLGTQTVAVLTAEVTDSALQDLLSAEEGGH